MDGMTKTIVGRMTLAVFLVHLVVLPILYFGVLYVVKQSNEDLFLNYVRGYTRFIADSFERIDSSEPDSHIVDILDGFMLSGSGVYAELQSDSQLWTESLGNATEVDRYSEDFEFGDHDDDTYYTSVPVDIAGNQALLRLGFDEQPIVEQNNLAYLRGGAILLTYLLLIMLLVAIIGRHVIRPIKALQVSSRKVASGHFLDRLTVDSDLIEFVELSNDLELMRSRLTGANRQLQKEIKDREKAQEERSALEAQLRHHQRIETVGTLAGGIAHELNNILVPILLFADMAIEDLPPDSPAIDDIRRVVKSANRAKSIVSQVLTFSRQIGDTHQEPVNLADIVAESLELISPAIPPNIKIKQSLAPDTPFVTGDSSMLGQLVVNLCTNAYQAMHSKGGILNVELRVVQISKQMPMFDCTLQPGRYAKLLVSDTGEGIDAKTVERIFEPFYSTRAIGGGTGLGLSVVHGIVSSMEGGIDVKSNLNMGTVFEVYLPSQGTESEYEISDSRGNARGEHLTN